MDKKLTFDEYRKAITILQRAYNRPVTAHELTSLMFEIRSDQSLVLKELDAMEIEGLVTKYGDNSPYRYTVNNNTETPKYYYVYQNHTFKKEYGGEYLWKPKEGKAGNVHHWSRLQEVKKGDVIFHSYRSKIVAVSVAKNDAMGEFRDVDGWRVNTEYFLFPNPISPRSLWNKIKDLQPDYAPFDKYGSGNMGYLFNISKGMAEIFLDAIAGHIDILDEREDQYLVDGLKYAEFKDTSNFRYNVKPKKKAEPVTRNGHPVYPRDRKVAINALAQAGYVCEIDAKHPTFIRKNANVAYTEPHHLVPMSQSENFDISLDVEENVVSLCSNCHNQIHYGAGAEKLLSKLYSERKNLLLSVGIDVSLAQLLEMYE